MAHRDPVVDEEPTIGKLVTDASRDISELIHSEITLAKSELRVSIKTGGISLALFALAGFLGLLGIIMLSIAIAFFIHWAGLELRWSFLIVFGGYFVLAGLLGLVGFLKVRKVRGPRRAITQAKQTQAVLKRSRK